MEDLLREEEFIAPKLNPWKRFGVIYVINFAIISAFFIIQRFVVDTEPNEFLLAFILGVMPFCSSFLMIFHIKNYIYLPYRTVSLAIFLMMGLYIATIAMIAIIANGRDFLSNESLEVMIAVILIYILLFAVALSSILLILNRKKRKRDKIGYAA